MKLTLCVPSATGSVSCLELHIAPEVRGKLALLGGVPPRGGAVRFRAAWGLRVADVSVGVTGHDHTAIPMMLCLCTRNTENDEPELLGIRDVDDVVYGLS